MGIKALVLVVGHIWHDHYSQVLKWKGLTHKQTDDLGPKCDDVQLVEGDVEERHETVKALKEDTFHHQRWVPLVHCPECYHKRRKKSSIHSWNLGRLFHLGSPKATY